MLDFSSSASLSLLLVEDWGERAGYYFLLRVKRVCRIVHNPMMFWNLRTLCPCDYDLRRFLRELSERAFIPLSKCAFVLFCALAG
jgi:hypothetical protein